MDDLLTIAIEQAKKDGNKGIVRIQGGWEEHHKINQTIRDGKKEVYIQRFTYRGSKMSVLLVRTPVKVPYVDIRELKRQRRKRYKAALIVEKKVEVSAVENP